jgi:hypothetical protein
MFMSAEYLVEAQATFEKSLNVTMTMAVLAKRTDISEDDRSSIKLDFVDRLTEAR